MRMMRFLLVFALLCGVSSISKADDFRMVVLDPPPPSFPTFPIFSSPFTFTFAPCAAGQLPTGTMGSYDGCFSGVNRTGQDWTSLTLNFGNNTALSNAAPAVCSLDGGGLDIFSEPGPGECDLSNGLYTLIYKGGLLTNNENFVIAEQGVDPDDFPEVTATFTTSTTVTPEPESIWLMSTGLTFLGSLVARRRRS
jgi:hypothetical protein